MEPDPKKKILFLVLTICFVFLIAFSETIAAAEIHHDCRGEECSFCLQIKAALFFIKTLKIAGIALLFGFCLMFPNESPQKKAESFSFYVSPVMLKVRFNS